MWSTHTSTCVLRSQIRNCKFAAMTARAFLLIGLAFGFSFAFGNTGADSSDHIGPDSIQSENCLIVTPERSIVCRGRHNHPEGVSTPTLTINCNPGIFIVITHNQIVDDSSIRMVTLEAPDGKFTQQWLAPSDFQSAGLFFYQGWGDSEYESTIRFVGSMLQPETTEVGFSINDGTVTGKFALTSSDRHLLRQIAPSCN